MQKKVKVLLLKPLINKGNAGDIAEVKTHFALNVLIPQGIAVVYDKQAQNQHETHMKKANAYKNELKSRVIAMLETLKNEGLTFEKQATDNDALYDSITERSLSQYLMHQYNINLTSSNFVLENKIEQLGDYSVEFIYEDVKGSFPITVIRK